MAVFPSVGMSSHQPLYRRLPNLPIRVNLLMAFGCGLAILIGQGVLALQAVIVNRTAAGWVDHTLAVIGTTNAAVGNVAGVQVEFRGFLLTDDAGAVERLQRAEQSLEARLRDLEVLTADNQPQVARWQNVRSHVGDWHTSALTPGIDARLSQPIVGSDFTGLLAEDERQADQIRSSLEEAIGIERVLLEQRSNAAEGANTTLVAAVSWGTLGTAILGGVLGLLMSHSIAHALARVAATAEAIAGGELSRRVGMHGNDEVSRTAGAVDRMAQALERNVGRLEAIITAQTDIARARLDRTELMDMITARAQSLTGATGAAVEMASDAEMVYTRPVAPLLHSLDYALDCIPAFRASAYALAKRYSATTLSRTRVSMPRPAERSACGR